VSSKISRDDTPRAGDVLVRTGAAVFVVGAVATIATVIPLFLGITRLPVGAYAASMLMPVGLALALGGLLRAARAERRPRPR
jgi:predicted phage tail protein